MPNPPSEQFANDSDQSEKPFPPGRGASILRMISAVMCVAVFVIYALQPDGLAAVTVIPAFCWLGFGLAVSLAGFRRSRRKASVLGLMLWGAFAVLQVPETISVARGWINGSELDPPPDSEFHLRVISFNTGLNGPAALRELATLEPDVVLLQEIPSRDDIERLGRELFGDTCAIEISENGTAILAQGQVVDRTPIVAVADADNVRPPARAVRVTVETVTGKRVELISLHLSPPVVRFDYWSPACWRSQSQLRRMHRQELNAIAGDLPAAVPVIFGGDFNAPARDGCTSILGPRLVDAFEISGLGWGNTGTNRSPLHRVDQIWVSPDWEIVGVAAVPSEHSDHRIVICDLRWP